MRKLSARGDSDGGGDVLDRSGGLGISGGGEVARAAESDPLSMLFDIDLLRRGFCTFESASIWSYTAYAHTHSVPCAGGGNSLGTHLSSS